jgi:hypothetical protein
VGFGQKKDLDFSRSFDYPTDTRLQPNNFSNKIKKPKKSLVLKPKRPRSLSAFAVKFSNRMRRHEIAQNRILKTIIVAAFVNGMAVILWLMNSWVESGMPWPIFPWL